MMAAVRDRIPFPKQPVFELDVLRDRSTELPSLLDLPSSVLTHSGRSAIVLALELLGIGRGDRVLVPTYHCPTMIAPIERVGAEPSFYRLTSSGSPNLEHLEGSLVGRVRAMLVPHLFGIPANLEDAAKFCRHHDIALIEDCAHCFFGLAGQSPIGTTGALAIGSLPKFFPLMVGGILASATRSLAASRLRAQSIRHELKTAWDLADLASRSDRLGPAGAIVRGVSRGRRAVINHRENPSGSLEEPSPDEIRSNGLSDPMLRRVGLSRIETFILMHSDRDQIVRRRRENYLAISSALSDLADVELLFPQCGLYSAPYAVPILVRSPDAPYARMRAAGLPVFRWDRLWPGTPLNSHDAAAKWSRGLIQIACHQSLRKNDINAICNTIRECLLA
jgi:dTDP-4-amino-4,6-dideoxygalactose transaminase